MAMEAGNLAVAQENMARALSILQTKERTRKKRSTDNENDWSPNALFEKLKASLGDEGFKELLHINNKITVAFVIDTSKSMLNDMKQVNAYIDTILNEHVQSSKGVNYLVTTFSEPQTEKTRKFATAAEVRKYVRNIETANGYDCQERTCAGIFGALTKPVFSRYKNSVLHVFTDASSKDCYLQSDTIQRQFATLQATANFVLFDTCNRVIDKEYISIARATGGFCYLVKDAGVYDMLRSKNGDYYTDTRIFGEYSDDSNSVTGQGLSTNRVARDISPERNFSFKNIIVDMSMESFIIYADIFPPQLTQHVTLEMPSVQSEHCGDALIKRSEVDGSVILKVRSGSCPCVGVWQLRYPKEAESFGYTLKGSGEYLISFESYFVDEISQLQIASTAPCLGKTENLIIKINQHEKILQESLMLEMWNLASNKVVWRNTIKNSHHHSNTYIIKVDIPNEIGYRGFTLVLTGQTIDGSQFRRISTQRFRPSLLCVRVLSVNNYYALFPGRRTKIQLELSNNDVVDEVFTVRCANTNNYRSRLGPFHVYKGGQKSVQQTNPVVVGAGERAEVNVYVQAPKQLSRGQTVTVSCEIKSTVRNFIELIYLTEVDRNI